VTVARDKEGFVRDAVIVADALHSAEGVTADPDGVGDGVPDAVKEIDLEGVGGIVRVPEIVSE